MKKFAVIVAGGIGSRMNATVPKQFLLLQNKPILWHSINAFTSFFDDIEIIVVLPENHTQQGFDIANIFSSSHKITITTGGETRFDSVKNGLNFVEDNAIVFVHDAVRCLIDKQLIINCYNEAIQHQNAIPAIAATDSIRMVNDDKNFVVDRNKIRIIQTPQTFASTALKVAYQQNYQPYFTDEATVAEAYGMKINLIEGNYNNIKITRPIDILIAEKILEERTL